MKNIGREFNKDRVIQINMPKKAYNLINFLNYKERLSQLFSIESLGEGGWLFTFLSIKIGHDGLYLVFCIKHDDCKIVTVQLNLNSSCE